MGEDPKLWLPDGDTANSIADLCMGLWLKSWEDGRSEELRLNAASARDAELPVTDSTLWDW